MNEMTDRRRAYLKRLDISKIHPNGRYVDISNSNIFNLTPEDIRELRNMYHNPNIACEVSLTKKRDSSGREVPSYKVVREQKYNTGKHRTKKNPSLPLGRRLIIGGVVVFFAFQLVTTYTSDEDVYHLPTEEMVVSEQNEYTLEAQYAHLPVETLSHVESDDLQDISPIFVEEETIVKEEDERSQLIRHICDIYQVDYDIVYNKLIALTDDFTSEQYLNGYIPGVVCKGEEVVAQSEEELLIYAIRCMKQLPDLLSVPTNGLYIHNDYDSGTDYYAQIDKVASVLGLNRCLLYAIVQSECGFDSELFRSNNNPAGLKNSSGDWWNFSTKEEGFLELGLEVLKYYKWIGKDATQIDYETLSQIRDIHAPLSDGNEYWLPNVVDCLSYAQEHEQELFGTTMENNGLSR